MKIQPIVDGHGEVRAFPVLLRRLVHETEMWAVDIGKPIRRLRPLLVDETGVRQAVRLALKKPNCGAVLLLLDGDDDCPADLGPAVQDWAATAAGESAVPGRAGPPGIRSLVLAAVESLRGRRGIRIDAESHPAPESPRGAKEQLEARMGPGATYLETTDQPAFSELFSLPDAYRRSRSFRKLADSVAHLVRAMGHDVGAWPPSGWTGGP